MHYDTFERFSVQPHQVKLFQLEAQQQYEIKFTRETGYFYVKVAVCQDKSDEKSKKDRKVYKNAYNNYNNQKIVENK